MKLKIYLVIMLILSAGLTYAQRNTLDTFKTVTITGSISEVNHPIANFKSEDGTVYQIHMGPYWYWLDNGYKLNNESAVIKGEVKTVNGINELYPVEVSQNGASIKLTDDNGIPLWAGNRGNGNGYGWNNGSGRGNGYGWNNGYCKYDSVKCANCTNPGSCCINNGGCRYGKGNGNGNGYGWRNGNGYGNGNRWGNCRRNSTDNSVSNTGNGNGRGWRQNCPNRNK